jgi:hypothetical protein
MNSAMPTNTTSEKQQVHDLVERLAPNQVTAVRGLLEAMLDPVGRAIANAPADDEPITEEDRRRLREGRSSLARHGGKGVPMEEVVADFGLTLDDFSEAVKRSK